MTRSLFVLSFLFIALSFPLFAQEQPDEGAALNAILQNPDASPFAKRMACNQAARTGTAASVAPLAAVLLDESLSHYARIGLQQIPGPEATAALCQAIPNAKGNTLIGILGSLGERRDPAAVDALVPLLKNDDPQTVKVAAKSLGKIGDANALSALQSRFAEADVTQKALLVDGLFASAERLVAEGKTKEASNIYASIRAVRELPITLRGGAIRGEILTLGPAAGPVLESEMLDSQESDFLAAIGTGRDLAAPEMTMLFVDLLAKLDPTRKILLLDLLDCRGDMKAKDAVLALAKNEPDTNIRQAAIRALAGHPNDETIAFLLDLVAKPTDDLTASGVDALVRMQSNVLEAKIVDRLKQTKGQACIPLVNVCSLRKIAASTPILLPLLSSQEDDVRLAVITALGNTVSGGNIEVLAERLMKPDSNTEFEAVKAALLVVCYRTVDQNDVAGKLAAIYDQASLETKIALLDLFGALGGSVAIDAVHKAVADPTEAIQDNASRVLGAWPDPEAAPVLLTVMQNPDAQKFHNRALRGYIRIVRQMDTSNEHRFNMCMQALEFSVRNEEKLLLVDALGRIPIPQSLDKLLEFIDIPEFMEPACLSAVNVGRAIVTQHREKVALMMQKVIDVTQDPETKRLATEILSETGQP